MPRIQVYGPSVGEHSRDQTMGPTGQRLRIGDVAVSGDLLTRYFGWRPGQPVPVGRQIVVNGRTYRVGDISYRSPGRPNVDTVEIWNGNPNMEGRGTVGNAPISNQLPIRPTGGTVGSSGSTGLGGAITGGGANTTGTLGGVNFTGPTQNTPPVNPGRPPPLIQNPQDDWTGVDDVSHPDDSSFFSFSDPSHPFNAPIKPLPTNDAPLRPAGAPMHTAMDFNHDPKYMANFAGAFAPTYMGNFGMNPVSLGAPVQSYNSTTVDRGRVIVPALGDLPSGSGGADTTGVTGAANANIMSPQEKKYYADRGIDPSSVAGADTSQSKTNSAPNVANTPGGQYLLGIGADSRQHYYSTDGGKTWLQGTPQGFHQLTPSQYNQQTFGGLTPTGYLDRGPAAEHQRGQMVLDMANAPGQPNHTGTTGDAGNTQYLPWGGLRGQLDEEGQINPVETSYDPGTAFHMSQQSGAPILNGNNVDAYNQWLSQRPEYIQWKARQNAQTTPGITDLGAPFRGGPIMGPIQGQGPANSPPVQNGFPGDGLWPPYDPANPNRARIRIPTNYTFPTGSTMGPLQNQPAEGPSLANDVIHVADPKAPSVPANPSVDEMLQNIRQWQSTRYVNG